MTISLIDLWMPIILGTFLLWIVSGIVHMVVKYHNTDYQKLKNENEVMDAVRNGSPRPGVHSFPHCIDMNEMKDEAVQTRFNTGPVGFVTILQIKIDIIREMAMTASLGVVVIILTNLFF